MLQKHKLTPTRGSLFNCSESLNLNIQNITTMYIDQTSILLIALIITIGASLLIMELLCAKKALARREKDYKALRKVHEKNHKIISNLPEEHTFYSVDFDMLDYYDSYTPYKWFASIEEAKKAIATHNKEAFEIQKEFIKLDLPYKQRDLNHEEPHSHYDLLKKWQQASKTIALSMGKGEGLVYGHASELPALMEDPYINEKTIKFTIEDMIENVLTDRN